MILTKADGDARGGAALSVREITGAPLLFLGTGEKSDGLEPFDPDRMARRILGMGDVVALVEEVRRNVDTEEAERLAKKVAKGKGFDFNDLKSQLQQLQKMGGMESLLDKLPGGAAASQKLRRELPTVKPAPDRADRFHDAARAPPSEIIDGSRRRRICGGSGHAGPGREPAAQAAPEDAADDEAAGQRQAGQDDGRDGRQAPGDAAATLRALQRRELPVAQRGAHGTQ